MTHREFADGFRQALKEKITDADHPFTDAEAAKKFFPRNWNLDDVTHPGEKLYPSVLDRGKADKTVASRRLLCLDSATHTGYDYPLTFNNSGGSEVIDGWWEVIVAGGQNNRTSNDDSTDVGVNIGSKTNPHNLGENLGSGGGLVGIVGRSGTLAVGINIPP